MDALLRLRRARVRLQRTHPFFADLLFFIKFIEDDKLDSAGVDCHGNFYFLPKWIDTLTDEEIRGLLVHEILHLALLHLQRGFNKHNRFIWNLAADCHANFIAKESNLVLPKQTACIPDVYDNCVSIVGADKKVICRVKNIKQKHTEAIYHELLQKLPKTTTLPKGFDVHIFGTLSEQEQKNLEEVWKQRVVSASVRVRSIGKLPASIERLVGQLISPKINWREKLYKHIVMDMPCDFTFRRPHKRSSSVGWYMPSYKKEHLNVAVWMDTSGSISKHEITVFLSEVVGICKAFNNIILTVGWCDTKVHGITEVTDNDVNKIIELKPKGGGGTDLRNIFPYMDKHMPDVQTTIIFTDGFTPFPNQAQIKNRNVLWVLTTNKDIPHNIGEVVRLRGS